MFKWWQILHSFESIALWSLFSRLDLAGVEGLQVKRLRHLSGVVLAVVSGLGSSEQKPWPSAPCWSDSPDCHPQMPPTPHPGAFDCTDSSCIWALFKVQVHIRCCELGPLLARNVSVFRSQAVLHGRYCSVRGLKPQWIKTLPSGRQSMGCKSRTWLSEHK